MGLGGLASSWFSGWLVDRFGSRTMTMTTSAALALWLPMLGLAPTAFLVFASLLVLGALDGLTDVAMNSQAVELQRRIERSIITRFHAVWSAGAVTGGILASRAAAAGISLRVQLLVTGARSPSLTLIAARYLLPDRRRRPAPRRPTSPRPRRPPAGSSSCCSSSAMAIALTELPPNDWSALLLADRFDLSTGRAGLGFVADGRRDARRPGRRRPRHRPNGARADAPGRCRPRGRRCRAGRDAALTVGAGARAVRRPGSACRRCSRSCSAPPATSRTARTAAWHRSRPVPGSASCSPRR